MSVYKASFWGRRAYWKPEHTIPDNQHKGQGKIFGLLCQTGHLDQIRKMMRKFKALKRSAIAKSTQSLNSVDFGGEGISARYTSPNSSKYSQNDHHLDDNSSVLDGFIDLSVLLPDGRRVRMPIHARTPMMDVLVQVTTANGINTGGMMLKVPVDIPPGYLHYKPNMPIGKLDCTTVEVVPKAAVCERPRKHTPKAAAGLPFEPTIRIQVNLPKSQKTFLRVSPQLTLREIFRRICEESNLVPVDAYELRSAKSIGFPLCLDRRLEEVGIVDFTIIPVSSSLCKSTGDLLGAISRMSQEEKEKRKTKRFFGLLKRKPTAPQPVNGTEIQKITLDGGEAAVEIRSPEKSKRASGKDRPLSMPSVYMETSDGETGWDGGQKRDAAVKPKKRQAPPPPPSTIRMNPNMGHNLKPDKKMDPLRSHHARRGSDSSSGYHGSSQPSPNPPAVSELPGAAHSSNMNASGSEKSSFSYKSHASSDNGGGQREDHLDIAMQKRKHKAPLPPAKACASSEEIVHDPVTSTTSAVQQSNIFQGEPQDQEDSRCSSPGTAEDLDKDFQEMIQQIENQISAEDDEKAAKLAGQGEGTTTLTTAQQAVDAPQVTELVVNTDPPKRTSDADQGSTVKPADVDEIRVTSYHEIRLNSAPVDQAKVEKLEKPQEKFVVPLPQRTDGLLMIKRTSVSTEKPIAQFGSKRTAVEDCVQMENVETRSSVQDMSERWNSENAQSERTVESNTKHQPEFEVHVAFKKPEPPAGPVWTARRDSNDAPHVRLMGNAKQQQQSTVVQSELSSGPSIVLCDPKKNMYPSMKVKSFEDEYYTKPGTNVASDYVKAVRYGLANGQFAAGKEEREKNRGKLEAAVAKKAISLELGTAGIQCGLAVKTPAASEETPGQRDASPTPAVEANIQLQREYEKLQAMFADWQFRLKQNETLVDAGRKLLPEQVMAFQRLQDEMMEQHRYVQEYCAHVQRLEREEAGDGKTVHSGDYGLPGSSTSEMARGRSMIKSYTVSTEASGQRGEHITKHAMAPALVMATVTDPKRGVSAANVGSMDRAECCPAGPSGMKHSTTPSQPPPAYSSLEHRRFGRAINEPMAQQSFGTAPPPPPIMPSSSVGSSSMRDAARNAKIGTNRVQATSKSDAVRLTKQHETVDARGDLLASIRNFGGTGGLRKTAAQVTRV